MIARLQTWLSALEDWLAEEKARRPYQYGPRPGQAVRSFWAFSRKEPWEVGTEDGKRWAEALKKEGLAGSTILFKVQAVRRFYAYCDEHASDPQGLPPENPASGIHLQQLYRRSRVVALTANQVRVLLGVVDRETTLIGKRDYAMLLLALRLGLKRDEIRSIRWEQIQFDGAQVRLSLTRRKQPVELNLCEEPWEAIQASLAATGRLEGIGPQDYVFAPIDRRHPMPRPGDPAGWNHAHPIHKEHMEDLLRQYLHWAGMDRWGIIGWSTLRRTAFARRLEAGEDLLSLHALLGNGSLESSRRFLRQLRKEAAAYYASLASMTGQPLPGPHRRPKGPTATHGFYIKRLRRPGTFKEGIERWHKTAFIALEMAEEAGQTKDGLRYLDVARRAFYRSSKICLDQARLVLELRKWHRAGRKPGRRFD